MTGSATMQAIVPVESIAQAILIVRGRRVILDSDLARFYGVTTARLNQQVRRNWKKFPEDFAFQLTTDEYQSLMLHFATSKGGRRKLPLVYTEHGALQAANVINSLRAADASIYVIRAFIRLREILSTHAELSQKVAELESRLDAHDGQIVALIEAIRGLLVEPDTSDRRIGFHNCEVEDAK